MFALIEFVIAEFHCSDIFLNSCPETCYDERWGRVDKDSCPGNEFPVSVLSHKGMMSYFFENFNFTPKEVRFE